MKDFLIRHLIRFDGIAGLMAGTFSLTFSAWLAELYGLPRSIVVFNGIVNLMYGTYSSTLASLRHRPIAMVIALSFANCLWALFCFAFVFQMPASATVFAVGQALFEGVFVGSLGVLEWRYRGRVAGGGGARGVE